MQISKNEDLGIKITFGLKKNSGTVYWYKNPSKRKVVGLLSTASPKSGYLKVEYRPGVFNDGYFENRDDFLLALKSWTEPDLIKYCQDW